MNEKCDECDLSGSEAVRQWKESICIIQGAGRLECWGCPVTTCDAWEDPENPLSEATQAVALKAAAKLASRSKVIQPHTTYAQMDLVDEARDLAMEVADPEVRYNLKVDMACEAILQDILHAQCIKRRNQYTDRWAKGLKGRLPNDQDDAYLDRQMDQADADAAAEHYGVKPEDVLKRMDWFRNRRIVRLDHDL